LRNNCDAPKACCNKMPPCPHGHPKQAHSLDNLFSVLSESPAIHAGEEWMAGALCGTFTIFYAITLLMYSCFSMFAPRWLGARGLYPNKVYASNSKNPTLRDLAKADDYTLEPKPHPICPFSRELYHCHLYSLRTICGRCNYTRFSWSYSLLSTYTCLLQFGRIGTKIENSS